MKHASPRAARTAGRPLTLQALAAVTGGNRRNDDENPWNSAQGNITGQSGSGDSVTASWTLLP